MIQTSFSFVSVNRIVKCSGRLSGCGRPHTDQAEYGVVLGLEGISKRCQALRDSLLYLRSIRLHGLESFDQVVDREAVNLENICSLVVRLHGVVALTVERDVGVCLLLL